MIPELLVISGISGSGKSTGARNLQKSSGYAIVCRDDIRLAVFGEAFGERVDEVAVTQIQYASIRSLLVLGHDVISDNTNLHPSVVVDQYNIAREVGASIALLQVECTLSSALENNRQRGISGGRFVPEHVISMQEHLFVENSPAIREIYTKMSGKNLV